jgi:hypothetical protein
MVAATPLCKPNISEAGRRRRRVLGTVALVVAVAALAVLIALRAAWYWRLLVALPAALYRLNVLQAEHATCVLRAREGTFEHDDFSTTKVADEDAAASRAVAAGISRAGLIAGVVAAAIAVGSIWIR